MAPLSLASVVPPEVWDFHIGGYQVCEKWLRDRRGRALTYEDLEQAHDGKSVRRGYQCAKVVTALQETIRLMAAIDATLRLSLRTVSDSRTATPKWPLE